MSKISKFFDLLDIISTFLVGIAMVLVLLFFENMTNTNTILTAGIVLQYNTSRIVHLCFKMLVMAAWSLVGRVS